MEFSAPNRLTIFAGICGIAGLHNESLNVPYEATAAVVIAGAQSQKILTRLWACLAEELDFNIANVGVQCDRLEIKTENKINIKLNKISGLFTILTAEFEFEFEKSS